MNYPSYSYALIGLFIIISILATLRIINWMANEDSEK